MGGDLVACSHCRSPNLVISVAARDEWKRRKKIARTLSAAAGIGLCLIFGAFAARVASVAQKSPGLVPFANVLIVIGFCAVPLYVLNLMCHRRWGIPLSEEEDKKWRDNMTALLRSREQGLCGDICAACKGFGVRGGFPLVPVDCWTCKGKGFLTASDADALLVAKRRAGRSAEMSFFLMKVLLVGTCAALVVAAIFGLRYLARGK
jgi:hypothetical protein